MHKLRQPSAPPRACLNTATSNRLIMPSASSQEKLIPGRPLYISPVPLSGVWYRAEALLRPYLYWSARPNVCPNSCIKTFQFPPVSRLPNPPRCIKNNRMGFASIRTHASARRQFSHMVCLDTTYSSKSGVEHPSPSTAMDTGAFKTSRKSSNSSVRLAATICFHVSLNQR